MPLPKSVTKVSKNGITFIDSVDRANFTIKELTRAAQKDVAKFLRKRLITAFKKMPGMKRSKRVYSGTKYWVRKIEADLQIGLAHDTWYSARSELGEKGQPARNLLRATVMESVPDIRRIQGQYLSAIEDENRAIGLIDEDEATDNGGAEG